jgi:diacylglycerol kinase (ATP)
VLPASSVRRTQSINKDSLKKDAKTVTNGSANETEGRLKIEVDGTFDAQKLKEMNRKRSIVAVKTNSTTTGTTTSNRKHSWWHRALARPRVQWNDWSIDSLPPQCKPILVFVNVKSGPQVGEMLHRRFLRLLHPLQVVCLPRDSPEPALRLFAFLPGVRILCVGGDGTAGWIMSCLDKLAEEKREERRRKLKNDIDSNVGEGDDSAAGGGTCTTAAIATPNFLFMDWTPPPVAIIPLGTGNDLARCLGWGSGYGSWRLEGASGALEAAAEASVALLDRWTLTFIEKPASSHHPVTQQEKERASIVDSGEGAPDALVNNKIDRNLKNKSSNDTAPTDQVPAASAASPSGVLGKNHIDEEKSEKAPTLSISTNTNLSMLGLLSPRVLSSSLSGTPRGSAPPPLPPKEVKKAMSNYLGIGVDAKVALEFHEMRETYPQWFQSQFGNKLVYTGMGALDIVSGDELNLPKKVIIECDGVEVPLPRGAEGIIIVNIPSYMGGIDLWASGQGPGAVQGSQSMCDGKLEIVAVGGSWHLGQLTVGLSRAERLRQGRKIVVRTAEALPMQIDGEPFVQPAGEVSVALRGQSRVLRRVENKPIAKLMRAVEEALESAADKGVISGAQHDALAGELAARIHPQL